MLLHETSAINDENGRGFVLTEELSSGGQGTVYRTQSSTDLVKLFNGERNALEVIARVRRMPLAGLPVARPMSLVSEPNGYTLQFQRDMEVVRSMKYAHKNSVTDWWLDTGGLVRRLWLGAKIASIFERLQSRGLVYGDVSSNNIMVSKSADFTEVSLIDLDNLFYFGERDSAEVWTPTYSAPEIAVNSSAPTFASDNFSLAVILFELITMVHPFMDGDSVKIADTDSERYELALRCMVPSVIDSSGENICSKYSIQNEQELVGQPLLDLFNKTYKTKNLDIDGRASAGQFRLNLVRAALSTIECNGKDCAWSYSLANLTSCPKCNHQEPYSRLTLSSPDGAVVAYEIILGSTKKVIDLALLFPVLQERARVSGSYVIEVLMLNGKARVVARNSSVVDVPRNIGISTNVKVEGLGDVKFEVVKR